MKRLAVYATYNPKGVVDEYIIYMAESLKKVADDIYIVSNHTYLDGEKEKLEAASRIYERADKGYDAGGYAHVIRLLEKENKLAGYDELILLNDSIFGPFYPLEDIFYEMERNTKIDFWAVTRRGRSDFDGGDSVYPEHLQIYFYVVRNKMLHSREFIDYWNGIEDRITDFRSAILNYEFEFTSYFESLGYCWDSYCKCTGYITDDPQFNLSPYHYSTYRLIKEERCPFLKRKLFTGEFVDKKYSDTQDLKKAVRYIDECTDYDIDMIWGHVLEGYQIADVIKAMHLSEIMDNGPGENESRSTDYETPDIEVYDRYSTFPPLKERCGHDSEFFLYLDLDKDIQPFALWESYYRNLYQNLCCQEEYVGNLLSLFGKEKRLGVIVPPFHIYGRISKSIEQKWMDSGVFEKLRYKYRLSVPCSVGRAPIHTIRGFVCRKQILPDGFIEDLKRDRSGTVMQMLPLFAQQNGYYTKIVVNRDYFASYADNLFSVLGTVWQAFAGCSEGDLDIDGMKDHMYRARLKSYIEKLKHVYVYGAGVLGYRIVRLIENDVDIAGILVNDIHGNPDKVAGYKVQSFHSFKEKDAGIIVAAGRKNNRDITKVLEERGFTNYILVE